MADFRMIERVLADFFHRAGIEPTWSRGDVFIGACTSEETVVRSGTIDSIASIEVPRDAHHEVINLTDLARQLARL